MRERKKRNVNWQGVLKDKGVKQGLGVKHALACVPRLCVTEPADRSFVKLGADIPS